MLPFARFLRMLSAAAQSGNPAADNRRTRRITCRGLTSSLGRISDISATGARIECKRFGALREGDAVHLRIDHPGGGEPVAIDAIVCWTATDDGNWSAGLAFCDLDAETAKRLASALWTEGLGPHSAAA